MRGEASPPPSAPRTAEQDAILHARLVVFFTDVAPSKVPSIPALMLKYTGKETSMLRALSKKYGKAFPPPPQRNTPPPQQNQKRRTLRVVVSQPGPLGVRFTLDKATCLPLLAADPAPTGRIALENGIALRAGDRIESVNGTTLASITAYAEGGSGVVDSTELRVAIGTMGLRSDWVARRGDAAHALTNDEIADEMLAALAAEGASGSEVLMKMMLDAASTMVARAPRPLEIVCSRVLAAAQREERSAMRVVVEEDGPLGIKLVLDTRTCMGMLGTFPSTTGLVERKNRGALRAGDRLESVNGAPLGQITAFDADGDGIIDCNELRSALATTALRAVWLAHPQTPSECVGMSNNELANHILRAFGADGSGQLNGDEVKAFMEMMLSAVTGAVAGSSRPLTLVFSRPTLSFEAEEKAAADAASFRADEAAAAKSVSPTTRAATRADAARTQAAQAAEHQRAQEIRALRKTPTRPPAGPPGPPTQGAPPPARPRVPAAQGASPPPAPAPGGADAAPPPPPAAAPAPPSFPFTDSHVPAVLILEESHKLLLRMRAARALIDERNAFSLGAAKPRSPDEVTSRAATFIITLLQRRCVRLAMHMSVHDARRRTGEATAAALASRYTMVVREDSGKPQLGIFIAPDANGVYTIVNVDPSGRIARQYSARCRPGDVMLKLNGVWTQGHPVERIYEALGHTGLPLVMECGRRDTESALRQAEAAARTFDNVTSTATPLHMLSAKEAAAWLTWSGNDAFAELVDVDGGVLVSIRDAKALSMFDDDAALDEGEVQHLLQTLERARSNGLSVADLGTALASHLAPVAAKTRETDEKKEENAGGEDHVLDVHDFDHLIKKPKHIRFLAKATVGIFGKGRHRLAAQKVVSKMTGGKKGYKAEKTRVLMLLIKCKLLGRRWRRKTKEAIVERARIHAMDKADKKRWRSTMLRDAAERERKERLAAESEMSQRAAHAMIVVNESAALHEASIQREMDVEASRAAVAEEAAAHAEDRAREAALAEQRRLRLAAEEEHRLHLADAAVKDADAIARAQREAEWHRRVHNKALIKALQLDVAGVHSRIAASKRAAHYNPLLRVEPHNVVWRGVARPGPPLTEVQGYESGSTGGVPCRDANRTWVAAPVQSGMLHPTSMRSREKEQRKLRARLEDDAKSSREPRPRVALPARQPKDDASLWLRAAPPAPRLQKEWLIPGPVYGTGRTPFFARCSSVDRWYEERVSFSAKVSLGIGVVPNAAGGGVVVERVHGAALECARVARGDVVLSISGTSALHHAGSDGVRTFAMQLREAMTSARVSGEGVVMVVFARTPRAQRQREARAMETIRRMLRYRIRGAVQLKLVQKAFAVAVGQRSARVRRVSLI